MNVEVNVGIKKYEFQLQQITQLCGMDIRAKNSIVDSLTKYFSTSKYSEYEDELRDNILICGENIGRRYFQTVLIESKSDLLAAIRLGKTSILEICLNHQMNEYDNAADIIEIENILFQSVNRINEYLARTIGEIHLDYKLDSLWSILKSSSIIADRREYLEKMDSYELFEIFLNSMSELQGISPEKRLCIFKNIDHIISPEQYGKIMEKCTELASRTDTWFITSISLQPYSYISKSNITGITIFNQGSYISLPPLEKIVNFIETNYPIQKKFDEITLLNLLASSVNLIGLERMRHIEEEIILKMFNGSMLVDYHWESLGKIPEQAFLQTRYDIINKKRRMEDV